MRTIAEITINDKPLQNILDEHTQWLNDNGGSRAYLQRANLRGAYLRGAYLRGAYLRGAYLRGADLQRADLLGADLLGADLRGADLRGAIGVYQFGPIGNDGRIGYAVASQDGPMFALGCHWGNLNNTAEAIIARYGADSLYEAQVRLAGKIVMEAQK